MADSTLNPEQQAAVTHGDGPLLIIAGAGTGKTTVVTQRIKYLILEKNIPASEILALTFTEKAAREMEERVDVALPYGFTQLWISTFHAFCDRILREEAIHIGLNPAYTLISEAEAILFLRRNLFSLKLDYFRPLGNPYKFLSGMLTHFSRLKDDDITPETYLTYSEKISTHPNTDAQDVKKTQELANAFKIYEELKAKEGVMDFSDIIANTLKLFRARPNILKHYQDKFKYVLVDEFQDTNFAQNELAMMLAGERKNINVVGDDDQSIYRWRGAAIANIIQFKEHYPESKIITLTKNYRSTAAILDTSYTLIQHNNPDRLEIKEKINKKLTAESGKKGQAVEFLFAERVENEAEQVVTHIKELSLNKKLQWKDIAILVRANDHAQPFVRALQRASIPFQFLGPGHLFHQDEIKDLLCYLKVLYNFEDSASLYRVLTMDIWGFSPRDIAAMLNYTKKKNLSLFETLENINDTFLSDKVKEKAASIPEMIKRHLKAVPRETAGQILYYFFEDSGLLERFLAPKTTLDEKRAQNIAKLFEKLKSYEANHEDASIFAVVDWIDLSMQLGESPLAADVDWSENNAVNILTIHSSKGLEFPAVFVVNLASQRFPSRERREQIPIPDALVKENLPEGDYHMQEERRLFYVAMTRAKEYLYVTAANFYGEGKRERKISPFVFEAFGEDAIAKLVKKHTSEKFVQQLSLLDIIKDNQKPSLIEQKIPATSTNPPVTYLSYSQIGTFDMCPLHYKLKCILKIPPLPIAPLNFGISVHNALRDYYLPLIQNDVPDIKKVKSILQTRWINEGYESKSHEKSALEHAEYLIKQYILNNKIKNKILALETPFQFGIPHPERGVPPLRMLGRIDRIDELSDGRIEIIDYKTGLNMLTEKEALTDMQLTLYALAATQVQDALFHKKAEEIVLSLHYVENNTIVSTTRTSDQLEEAKFHLLNKAKEIQESRYECNGNMLCKTCEYKMICQTFV